MSRTCEVIDPCTEQSIGTIALGSAADAEKTVAAARRAFASFSQTTNEERIEPLKRIVGDPEAPQRRARRNQLTGNGRAALHRPGRAGGHERCHFEQAIKAIEKLCLRLPIAGLSKVVTEHRAFPDTG
ncbi:UNVERIFIED_ORG: hypothetical protein GGD48_004401 [Rhizobium etli]|uniref:aldehyde dehydrogenase family protein n=1 Tax=Rhizobium sp. Kim5 TaxID=2020311 RepID=UPI000A2A07FF|nr:aldehyde dehydrogenase domain-containing protein [Rhizobium sp. Kim5]